MAGKWVRTQNANTTRTGNSATYLINTREEDVAKIYVTYYVFGAVSMDKTNITLRMYVCMYVC